MIYVTLLDQFHPGIYSSQVIDVCDFISKKSKERVRLVAFLSIREIKEAKPKIKALYPDSIVLPAAPGLSNFKYTAFLLALYCLFTGERKAICRNVFATTIALQVRSWGLLKKIVYDGRSAINAEIKEYDVFPAKYLRSNIFELEKSAVLNSDFRISVSKKLVEYWQKNYGYISKEHLVINCTLDSKYFKEEIKFDDSTITELRLGLGFAREDVILVYSGSTAPWQSFDLMYKSFKPFLKKDKKLKFIFLSRSTNDIKKFVAEFPDQVYNYYVDQKEVLDYLKIADYGILIREQSDTNRVAAPVKFAEYLYAGLKVIASENLGDYSEMIRVNELGSIFNDNMLLSGSEAVGRTLQNKFALNNFSKNSLNYDLLSTVLKQD